MSKSLHTRSWENASDYIEGIPQGKIQDLNFGKIDLEYNDLEFRLSPSFSDLVEDIGVNGQQFPIILRGIEGSRQFQIVSGYRRVRAIKELGWNTIKAIVRDDLDDDMAFRISFLENEKRKNLTSVDKAHAIAKLELVGKKPEEIQEIYGISARQYFRYKKVGTFSDELKDAISKKRISTGHGFLLMQVYEENPGKVKFGEWIERVEKRNLSVKQLRAALNNEFGKSKARARYMEKLKGGGFRLHPMSFNPTTTSKEKKQKMLKAMREAVELLEGKDRG